MVALTNLFSNGIVLYCEHLPCVLSLSMRQGDQTPESVLNSFVNRYSWFGIVFFFSW